MTLMRLLANWLKGSHFYIDPGFGSDCGGNILCECDYRWFGFVDESRVGIYHFNKTHLIDPVDPEFFSKIKDALVDLHLNWRSLRGVASEPLLAVQRYFTDEQLSSIK